MKITALGSKNIGVAELKNGTTLLVPNTKCGEKVQVKIEKVFFIVTKIHSYKGSKVFWLTVSKIQNLCYFEPLPLCPFEP